MKTFEIRKTAGYLILTLLCILPACRHSDANMPKNIVWNGVSENEAASMPFGNGEVGGNVWAEKDAMYLYMTRNDCFSELGRLLKVGRLKMSIGNGFDSGSFTQTLDFASGSITLADSGKEITVLAEYGKPVIWIHGRLKTPAAVRIEPEIWRTAPYIPNVNGEQGSMWSAQGFKTIPFRESADITVSGEHSLGIFHHNDSSIYRMTLDNNGLTGDGIEDPFLGRTFGAMMTADGFNSDGSCLMSDGQVVEFTIKIAVTSYADCSAAQWEEKTSECLSDAGPYSKAESLTGKYWRGIWDRSYIQMETPDTVTGERITEAYNCQRWLSLSAGLSEYPIKYNGSIFTLSSRFVNGTEGRNPDFRNWGECFWWQNTRLPYYSLIKTGDWDVLKGLFGFYERLMPVFREQAKVYHKASGATFPETITQFGTFGVSDFGYREPGDTSALFPKTQWIGRIMQGPLDLTHMMFDYVHYSGDMEYLEKHAFPMAEDFLEFFIDRNKPDSTDKMRIKNTQSLETYWYGVENDAPDLAGLHAVIKDFKSLPECCSIPSSLQEKISYLERVLPDIPIEKDSLGLDVFAPAEKYDPERCNCECPELMTVFPFKLSTFQQNSEIGRESYKMRKEKFSHGWPQDGQVAAILGLTDAAREQLIARIGNTNRSFKFPSYYGPNFDWTPDQCHGGNIMTIIQEMVMQKYDGNVYLLPAFPKDWNVRFKLASGDGKYISGEYSDGKWTEKPEIGGQTDGTQIIDMQN